MLFRLKKHTTTAVQQRGRMFPLHVNKRLDAILDTIAMHNKSIKFTNGFRIQIYVGNDRKAADDAKIYTYQKYPEIFPYLELPTAYLQSKNW